jgi:hypothetical protein
MNFNQTNDKNGSVNTYVNGCKIEQCKFGEGDNVLVWCDMTKEDKERLKATLEKELRDNLNIDYCILVKKPSFVSVGRIKYMFWRIKRFIANLFMREE